MEDFKIYLSFDIDQDFDPGSNDYYNRSKASFKSFGDGFSDIIDRLEGLPFSVFVRSDFQIKSVYGSYEYLVLNNKSLVDKIVLSGGELDWHIHLYKTEKGKWVQVTDNSEIAERFLIDYSEVKKCNCVNTEVVRIGECVMNDTLMNAIARMGIKIDSSALPGRKRNDKEKFFDWSITSNRFYNPSKSDYRIESNDNYQLIEVPMSTLLMKAEYDNEAVRRYFNLSFKTEILFQNFESYVKENDSLVVITHPFEVLSEGKHGLISYNIKTFENNIKLLMDKVVSFGKNPSFHKISSIIG